MYFIQLPPPVHGVSVINHQIYYSSVINKDIDKFLLEIKFSDRFNQLREFSIGKLFKFFKLCARLISVIIRKNPDWIYFSFMPVGRGLYRDAFFVLLIRIFQSKIIFHIHNRGIAVNSEKRKYRVLYRWLFKNSVVIHLSEKLIKEEFTNLQLNKTRFYATPNGIELKIDNTSKKESDKINLLFLSNLFAEKGIFELLEVFEKLSLEHPNLFLSIAGAPLHNFDQELNQYLAGKPHLKEKIKYHGPVYGEKKMQLLKDSDIFVFPSYFSEECFPLVILEAMAAGLPIVASNIGAVSEIIRTDETGLIFEPENKTELYERINILISDEMLRERLGLNGYELFQKKYTSTAFESRMLHFFNTILK